VELNIIFPLEEFHFQHSSTGEGPLKQPPLSRRVCSGLQKCGAAAWIPLGHRAPRPTAASAHHLLPALDSFSSLKTIGLGSFHLLRVSLERRFLSGSGKGSFHRAVGSWLR